MRSRDERGVGQELHDEDDDAEVLEEEDAHEEVKVIVEDEVV